MSVNLDAINLSKIDDPDLRTQLEAAIAEHRQLRLHYGQAKRDAQFQSHFLARISHELRSPLSGIIGSHQLVLADLCEDREEELEFIGQADAAALKLVKILDSILLVSRIEAGRHTPKIASIAIAKLVQNIREPIELEAANASVRFEAIVEMPELDVETDAQIFSAIAIDLLEQAIDYGRERQINVRLTCQPVSDRVEFQLDSALMAEDFSDRLDYLSHYAKSTPTDDRKSARQNLPQLALTPSMRLTLDTLLLELIGGGCGLPEAHPSATSGSRLRFWLPRSA